MRYTLAYIDEHDGWISTFYHTFKDDFEIKKIKVNAESSVDEIITNLFQDKLDAIVTDYLLDEEGDVSFNGNKIVDEIKKTRPHFPIIMLTAYEPEAISQMDEVHIIYGKNILDGESEDALTLFKERIKSNISSYHSKIENTKNKIEKLVKKRNETGLKLKEEEELTKLFILMDELEPEGKEVPTNLIQPEAITKLNELVAGTEDILKELKKMNKK